MCIDRKNSSTSGIFFYFLPFIHVAAKTALYKETAVSIVADGQLQKMGHS